MPNIKNKNLKMRDQQVRHIKEDEDSVGQYLNLEQELSKNYLREEDTKSKSDKKKNQKRWVLDTLSSLQSYQDQGQNNLSSKEGDGQNSELVNQKQKRKLPSQNSEKNQLKKKLAKLKQYDYSHKQKDSANKSNYRRIDNRKPFRRIIRLTIYLLKEENQKINKLEQFNKSLFSGSQFLKFLKVVKQYNIKRYILTVISWEKQKLQKQNVQVNNKKNMTDKYLSKLNDIRDALQSNDEQQISRKLFPRARNPIYAQKNQNFPQPLTSFDNI